MEFRANSALEDEDAAGNGGLFTAGPEQKRAFILPNTPVVKIRNGKLHLKGNMVMNNTRVFVLIAGLTALFGLEPILGLSYPSHSLRDPVALSRRIKK